MKLLVKCFFVSVLVCVFCGVPSFAQEQADTGAGDPVSEWRAVRAEIFDRLDKTGKGYIDENDWPGRKRAFRLMDLNNDGRITLDEFQSLRHRWRNRTFENLDLDGNRAITREEWMDIPADFDRFDRNKDGMILRHEFYNPR